VVAFSRRNSETLELHHPIDHPIDLKPGFKITYGGIYNLLEVILESLKAYLETNISNGVIQQESSSATAQILFVNEIDGGLQ
jgi:hypothetical protein